jgi:hypothetical protein
MLQALIVVAVLFLATCHGFFPTPVRARSFKTIPMMSFNDEFDTSSKPTPVAPPTSPIEPVEPVGEKQIEETPATQQQPVVDQDFADVSDSMRAKLRGELQAQGAYSNKKSANPILIISGIVALLVIAGGKDVFY